MNAAMTPTEIEVSKDYLVGDRDDIAAIAGLRGSLLKGKGSDGVDKSVDAKAIPRTEIIERDGQIALVFSDPAVEPWKRNRVAEMTEDEGTDCWNLVDIRLKKHPQLSPYGCSIGADAYHATFVPRDEQEAEMVMSTLREYRVETDGSIHWCTFDGIVRGHPEIDGYRPPRYLDFHEAGYFSRLEGMAKLCEMKAFWDAHPGSLADARIDNPLRQVGECELRGILAIETARESLGLPIGESMVQRERLA